ILRVSMPYSISTADAAVSNLTITFPKTHRRIPTGNVTLQPIIAAFGATELEYELTIDPATTPSPEDNKIDVAFDVVHFIDTSKTPAVSVTKTNVEKAGNIYNAANINELIEDMRDSLKKSVAVAKNSDEKPIFAGLNIAVPSGGGGKTEGNAD